jgi:6-pyruvoyltetrahydropterin/6-carboxytetrahydropterin synthase
MNTNTFSIKVYKEYFNFAASHFMIFKDGSREPLHGHNYRVKFSGNTHSLDNDMVFDFLNIKPIIRKVCDTLDHKLLIPNLHPNIKIGLVEKNTHLSTPDGSFFSIPSTDILLLPIENTSVERLAVYLANEIKSHVLKEYNYEFNEIELEVEETRGQSAVYKMIKEN